MCFVRKTRSHNGLVGDCKELFGMQDAISGNIYIGRLGAGLNALK